MVRARSEPFKHATDQGECASGRGSVTLAHGPAQYSQEANEGGPAKCIGRHRSDGRVGPGLPPPTIITGTPILEEDELGAVGPRIAGFSLDTCWAGRRRARNAAKKSKGIRGPGDSPAGPLPGNRRSYDHKHRFWSIRPYEFEDAGTLLADFWQEVDAVLKERGVIS